MTFSYVKMLWQVMSNCVASYKKWFAQELLVLYCQGKLQETVIYRTVTEWECLDNNKEGGHLRRAEKPSITSWKCCPRKLLYNMEEHG
jgi:hypothetical protein